MLYCIIVTTVYLFFLHLSGVSSDYLCRRCLRDADFRYSFWGASRRLNKAALQGEISLRPAAKIENIFLNFDFNTSHTEDLLETFNNSAIDHQAQSLLNRCSSHLGEKSQLVPLYTTGDGSCLFNAISLLLTGSENLAAELRVRTCIELCNNEDHYLSIPNSFEICKI